MRSWRSADGADRRAASIVLRDGSPLEIARALGEARVSPLGPWTFVVLGFSRQSSASLSQASEAVAQAALGCRVAIAVPPQFMPDVPTNAPTSDSVAVLLDIQDAGGSFATFLHPRVEAVRFSEDFVHRMTGDLRSCSVLESMVRLSRRLGLVTLGPDPECFASPMLAEALFDYVLEDTDPSDSAGAAWPSRQDFELTR